ncbi:transmembrane protein, putative [Rhizoctonia solani AG-3 Rhs1AP]|uniref:Transmembrane protein, putative n=1 Tax=Rhizoctonia solani AG-3 Rhs1AP TaxID=1086054 RepID=X8IXK3_9AGAM|nr:transmembrane protein, putative [Rhizoctonia solani AG-3 Rhs1AP]
MSTVNVSTKQETAGSRLAQISTYARMLFQKSTYVNGVKNGVLTLISVLSIVTLYSVIGAVWARNAIRFLKGRKATNVVVTRKTPPGDSDPIAKPVEDIGLNMDDVQEIPGEGELAVKEAMPARDQIPEIDDEPQVENTEERHIMSDDDTTVVGQDDLVDIKGSPVVVPVIKDDFERPLSPPRTPPASPPPDNPELSDMKAPTVDLVEVLQDDSPSDAAPVVNVVPDESYVLREASARNSTIEEAAKAVEEHAKFVEDAISPTESTAESSTHENDSPVSEFVVVSDAEEKPVENMPAPIENFNKAAEEAESKLSVVAESTPTEVPVLEVSPPAEPAVEPKQTPIIVVEEPKIDIVAPVVEEPKPVEEVKQVEEPKAVEEVKEPEALKAFDEPQVIEEPKVVEEPKTVESKVVEEPVVEEPKAEEPKVIEEPESVESPKVEGSPRAFPSVAKPGREDSVSSSPPKSLARPRVVRRATGSTAAIAGITTSAAPATVAVTSPIDDQVSPRALTARRANDALNRLAGSILRSNTSERLPSRPTSPIPSGIPRATSPPPRPSSPRTVPRSASPANVVRSESPSSDAGSRPTSPTPGMARRGSIVAPRPASRQSILANVTNAPERSSPPARRMTFANPPRGGSMSPPPMPLPPQRRGSQGTVSFERPGSLRVSPSPQVPQAAVTSPSVLSRNATIDSNGSPGSPPNSRRAASPSPARSPAEEATRRNMPFPSPVEGQSITVASAVKQRPRPRTSTSGSATAPNTLLSTLTSKITFPGSTNSSSKAGSNPVSPGLASPISPISPASPASPASPNRSDSLASAVNNRSSIYSFSDMSDMDMSTSDLDFAGRESHRMVLNGARFDSMSSVTSSDGGMSGNEEEKREKRAKRRAKARAQALKKQKRSKRN